MSVRWCGPRAFLVERERLEEVLGLHATLEADPPPELVDAVPAARTLLLTFRGAREAKEGARLVDSLEPGAGAADGDPRRELTIDVVYDGEDLADVAALAGLSPEGVVAAHTGATWTAAFGGFAPGFFYLTGGDPRLAVPRRPSPRTAVPAGAVALAGEFSAVYPRRSPGGWQLIGRTEQAMFDLQRDPPALLRAGDAVTFRAAREHVSARAERAHEGPVDATPAEERPVPEEPARGPGPDHDPADAPPTAPSGGPALEVLDPGLALLVEDAGRPGLAGIGVAASGAADADAARQANRLVGNDAGAAVLENPLGGAALRARGTLVLALTGASAPAHILGERPRAAPPRAPFALRDGETLRLGAPEEGLRVYLAVRGGVEASPVLGSRARDTLSGLGPAPLAPGGHVGVGPAPRRAVGHPEPPTAHPRGGAAELRVFLGPREDRFDSLDPLFAQDWVTTQESDRVGVRLAVADPGGTPLRASRGGELPSEGAVAGALQVPPSGLPVMFLADHPVTGGYPVVACLDPRDLPLAAQLPPGTRVRFRKDTS